LERKRRLNHLVVEYGSTVAPEQSALQPVAWAIDSWCLGSDGILPWQTIGTAESWRRADPLSLFYPPADGRDGPPVASIRLKAYRRGQQDVEYLALWADRTGQPRWAVGREVRKLLALAGERRGTGHADGEDAGVMDYSSLRPQQLEALRVRMGRALSEAAAGKTRASRAVVDFSPPRREPPSSNSGYVSVGDVPPGE
jgi:hypothetical protein